MATPSPSNVVPFPAFDRPAIKPLLIGVKPVPGESLLSMIARATSDNVHEQTSQTLAFAGFSQPQLKHVPFSRIPRVKEIATLLSVTEHDVRSRMHAPARQNINWVDWYGTPLHRRYIEATVRRVSPVGFGNPPFHHRAIWMLRPLTYCPESMEMLISSCPYCGDGLGWRATLGIWRCEKCGRSLRHHRPGKVRWDLRGEAAAAAAIISTDPLQRADALSRLPQPFSSWEAGDVFDTMVTLGVVATHPDGSDPASVNIIKRRDYSLFEPLDIVNGYRALKDWPAALGVILRKVVAKNRGKVRHDSFNTALGPMAKLLSRSSCANAALRRLLLAELPTMVRDLGIPLRGRFERG